MSVLVPTFKLGINDAVLILYKYAEYISKILLNIETYILACLNERILLKSSLLAIIVFLCFAVQR